MTRLCSWFLIPALLPVGLYAGTIYDVSLNTAALIGHAAGPFSVAFQLTDGNGVGDANNVAIIDNLQFGSGGPLGLPLRVGGAVGDLWSTVVLVDSGFPNV